MVATPVTPTSPRSQQGWDDPTVLLRVSEVADRLGVSRSTVYTLMASGRLSFVMIGRSRRIQKVALLDLIGRSGDGAHDPWPKRGFGL